MMDMNEFTGEFVAEAKANLSGIEGVLMDLERSADIPDPELVNRAFRAVHSVKGGAGFLGLSRLIELTHAMESLLALIRSRELRPTPDVVDALLTGIDLLNDMLDHIDDCGAYDISDSLATIQDILARDLSPDVKDDLSASLSIVDETGGRKSFQIDGFTRKNLPDNAALYVLVFDLNAIAESGGETPIGLIERLLAHGEILDARIDAPADDLHRDLADIPLIYETLYASAQPETVLRERFDVGLSRIVPVQTTSRLEAPPDAPADRTTTRLAAPAGPADGREAASGIRVAEEKIDALVALAGEFVTVEAALMAEAKSQKTPRLLAIAERVERLSTDLRDVALSVRMHPIRTIFGRFRRLVRDLSRQHGKEIALTTEGGGVELDRTVIERLYDPLTHIIRNSVDHGIDPPEVRTAQGKPAHGTVAMRARHVGGHVIIDVADDGAGLDPERIRRKAVEKGLMSPDEKIDEEALLPMIFAPGFSTMEAVSDLSGRGVGMDVVKRRVEGLGGDVAIESRQGRGTTISLKIPMSMAIIDGLLIRLDEERFLIPLSEASECVDLRGEDLVRARRLGAMAHRGTLIPFICLSQCLTAATDLPGDTYVVIVHKGDGVVGLGVQKVEGFQQAVIKPLGKAYRDIKTFSGSTILGDGSVALILDVHHLIETYGK